MVDGEPHSGSPLTWIAAAFAASVAAASAQIGADARWLAAIGAAIVHAGQIPHGVSYAAASSSGWHDAPALGQIVFHGAESLLGDRGLVVLNCVAVAVALCALVVDLRRADARDGAAAAVVFAVLVGGASGFLVVRAELFSLALFPVLVTLLRREATFRTGRIWAVVPLLALWANLHGGVLVGLALVAGYLVLHRARRAPRESAGVLAASCAAVLATPALQHTVDYYAGVMRNEAASEHFGLWGQLSLNAPLDLAFLAVAIPLLAAAVWRRPATWELAVLAALAGMTVEARRNGIWLLLFAATPAARALGASRAPVIGSRVALALGVVPLALALAALGRPPAPDGATATLLAQATRVAAGSPILAEPVESEQLALAGGRIWIGNPLDAFPRGDQRRYLDWLRGRRDGDLLLRWPVRVVVVQRDSAPQRRLATNHRFEELARDERAVLYAARA